MRCRHRRRRLSARDLSITVCSVRPPIKLHKEQAFGGVNIWQLRKKVKVCEELSQAGGSVAEEDSGKRSLEGRRRRS